MRLTALTLLKSSDQDYAPWLAAKASLHYLPEIPTAAGGGGGVCVCVEGRWGGGLGAHKKSQGGGPEQHVEVLFRMFFSVAKQITARVATQKECQCTTSYSHPGVNGPQDGGPLRDTGAQVRRA